MGGQVPGNLPEVNVPEVNLPDIDTGSVEDLGIEGGVPSATDMTAKLNEVFSSYSETLSDVTDKDSATEAVPELNSLNEKLGGIGSMMDKLPAGIRDTVTSQLGPMIEPIKAIAEKVLAIPGVGPILKPIIDQMMAKVGGLTA